MTLSLFFFYVFALIFIIWYSMVRFTLEFMREGYNWTFFGIPTAQVVSLAFVAFAVVVLVFRHRPGAARGTPGMTPSPRADDPDTVPTPPA